MLVELRLENYAVIDNVAVAFASGLNLLTGETGAGKSILIDALTLLLGDKASTDVIRSGADRAVISAVFEIESGAAKTIARILEENGLDSESDSVILRREIAQGGKGRVFVNNQPATVAVLKLLGPYLATVHAQNETLAAFDGPARLALLDAFAGSQVACVQEAFHKWKEIRGRIEELERDEQDRLRLLDLWTYQKREIEDAKLQAGEDERLENEKRVLANAEKIYNAAMNAFDLLYEGDSSTAASLTLRPQAGRRTLPLRDEISRRAGRARVGLDQRGRCRRNPPRLRGRHSRLPRTSRRSGRPAGGAGPV